MKAEPLSVGRVLSENHRFVVPIYQRTYTWTLDRQLEPLWNQIESKAQERLQKGKAEFPHYMGSLLVIPEGEATFGRVQAFDVVDGQQRLTTFHLCFAALRDVARSWQFEDLRKSLESLLIHGDDVPMVNKKVERYKLQPTASDRPLFRDLLDLDRNALQGKYAGSFHKNGKPIKGTIAKPLAAYWFMLQRAEDFLAIDEERARERFLAITQAIFQHFSFIVITLSREDDPQVIFETLNSGGDPLAAMDLVRNDVFMRASRNGENPESLLETHWSIFDDDFWRASKTQGRMTKPQMDFFLAHTLAAETGNLVSLTELYAEYKRYARARAAPTVADELANIVRYAPAYRSLVDPEEGTALSTLSHRLDTFDVSTAYPLVLLVATSPASPDEKDRLYNLIGSYIIRRALCGLTAKNYNIAFVEFARHMRQNDVSVESFSEMATLRKDSEASKFPTDEALKAAVMTRPQYGRIRVNRLRLVIEELELASRDKYAAAWGVLPGLSVEHIMPQQWQNHWPLPSGAFASATGELPASQEDAAQVQARLALIDTLPNLTLLTQSGNSSAGAASFEGKKQRLKDSQLRMNGEIAEKLSWTEHDIYLRATDLAQLAVSLWPAPLGV